MCAACPAGFFSSGADQRRCRAWTRCRRTASHNATVEALEGTVSSDRRCVSASFLEVALGDGAVLIGGVAAKLATVVRLGQELCVVRAEAIFRAGAGLRGGEGQLGKASAFVFFKNKATAAFTMVCFSWRVDMPGAR